MSEASPRRRSDASCLLLRLAVLSVPLGTLASLVPSPVAAHGTEARYVEVADWKRTGFTRTFAADRSHLTGRLAATVNGDPARPVPRPKGLLQKRVLGGQSCVLHDVLAFDVDDAYGFDVDETVTFRLTYAPDYSSAFVVGWDRNGGTGLGQSEEIVPEPGAPLRTVSITMQRARLAGQGVQGSDIAIASRNGIAVCDIAVERSRTTPQPAAAGTLRLVVKDAKTGALVPARVGLYDLSGRAPLASDQALMLQRFGDDLRMLAVNERTFWPSPNRQAFYVDGEYRGQVPAGTYELVATRGIEFRAWQGTVDVRAGQVTTVTVPLQRYADQPAAGWYSGDSHVHLTRDVVADPVVWGMVAAEDVHVGNLLEMGNIAGTHFKQPKEWGKASRFERDGHFIVSGQEDPRTWFFGHTIHHNLQQPIHAPPAEYFEYDKVFRASHAQGGISGFAHQAWGQRGSDPAQLDRAAALLAPLGQIDFIEVLQGGRLVSDGWYRLLNLGLRITPAAGSDWPYTDFPGVVRNYVKLDGQLNVDRWFDSFRAGHVVVTNGPLLEFSINGRQVGDELKVRRGTRLDILATARLNPDVGTLDRIEVVSLGDVVASEGVAGRQDGRLSVQRTAEHSQWIALRVLGQRGGIADSVIAHTAPIYVVVDDEPTWKADAVPSIVAAARAQLQRLLVEPIDATNDLEYWETRTLLADEWIAQRPMLKPLVAESDARYAKLLADYARFHPAAGGAPRGE